MPGQLPLFDEINAQLDYLESHVPHTTLVPEPAVGLAVVAPSVAESDLETASLGGSDLKCSRIGLGGASLGDLYLPIPNSQALATTESAYHNGVRFFDTSPWYGVGLSEARMGMALHAFPRDSYVLSTKVGRYLIPDPAARPQELGWAGGYAFRIEFDYSGSAFRRQHADSLQRLGIGKVDCLVIHDLEPLSFAEPHEEQPIDPARAEEMLDQLAAADGGFRELQLMREQGVIQAFGAGVNAPECANMYSLLNHSAHELGILDDCLSAGVSVVVGGPYSSGILAVGADPLNGATVFYNYLPASPEMLDRTRRIQRVCVRHGIPLMAAALQFPLGHPAVSCVIPGGKSPEEAESNAKMMRVKISQAFWSDLKTEHLLPQGVHVPQGA